MSAGYYTYRLSSGTQPWTGSKLLIEHAPPAAPGEENTCGLVHLPLIERTHGNL